MRVLENAVRLRCATGCGCGVRGDMAQRTVGWGRVDTAVGLAVMKRGCSDVLSEIDIGFVGYESLGGREVLGG